MSISIKSYKLSSEQEEAVNPSNNAWVQANAGSGKTEILAGRLLRILFRYKQGGKDITKIPGVLCLTFTETGAGEMKDRIIKTFSKWAMAYDEDLYEAVSLVTEGLFPTDDDIKIARQIFFDVIDNPDILQVYTIHGFCSDILKKFSLEAGLPPAWSVITEYDKRALLEKTFEKMINNPNMSNQTKEALQHIVSEQSERVMDTIYKILVKKYKTLFSIDNKKAYRKYFDEKLKEYLVIDSVQNVEPTNEELEIIKNEFIRLSDQQEDANIKKFYKKLSKSVDAYIESRDNFDIYKELFLTKKLKPLSYKPITDVNGKICRQTYLKYSPDILGKEAERVSKYAEIRYKHKLYKDTMAIFDLVVEFAELYKKTKHAYNVLDFDDLILYTTKLFENEATVGAVLQQLSASFGHILVDEAQDTSAQQWKIFNTLRDNIALHDYASLVVGDSKQAIFGFQDADTKGFAINRENFAKSVKESGAGEFHPVTLTTNYRSLSPILDTVDYFFDKFTKDDEETSSEIDIKFNNSKHVSFRSEKQKGGLVEIHKAFIPTESGDVAKKEYAKYIADEIERVLATEKVYDKDGNLKEITPNDIMVLVKGRNRVITHLLRFLKDKGIAVSGEDKIILNDFLPVRDLLNLIRFSIKDKNKRKFTNDYVLGCILKSPFYRLSESQIYDLCKEQQSLSTDEHKELLWNVLEKEYPDIHKDLSEICARCVSDAPYTFFNFVLSRKFNSEYNNRQKMISAMGKNIVDPLEEFLTQCLVYERTQSGTTKDFLKWFVTSKPEAKRDVKSAYGVKVMTIHGSKGLEAPVVFLTDTFNTGNKDELDLLDLNFLNKPEQESYDLWAWNKVKFDNLPEYISTDKENNSDKEKTEEYYRLLYVAMTRARDQLYIYGLGQKKRESSKDSSDTAKKSSSKSSKPKQSTSKAWHPMLWQQLSKIATTVPSIATIDSSEEEPEITTIRITDDTEIKNFFNNQI